MIRIGTRGSDLALWQARFVAGELARRTGEEPELVIVKTSGDRIQDVPLTPDLGKGFFTKEIEDGLLAGEFDLAVHSLKDLAVTMPDGLCLAAVTERADPADVLVMRVEGYDPKADTLPLRERARVGTSSPRRQCALARERRDLKIKDLRGNVPTRVSKLRGGSYEAIVLAQAGLDRLELDLGRLRTHRLDPQRFPCAPGQGALGIQARAADTELLALLRELHDEETARVTGVERGLLAALGGGCSLPLGAFCARAEDGTLELDAMLFGSDPERGPLRVGLDGDDPDELVELARRELEPVLTQPLAGKDFVTVGGMDSSLQLFGDLRAAGAEPHLVAAHTSSPLQLPRDELLWIAAADHVALASAGAAMSLATSLARLGKTLDPKTTLLVPGSATAATAQSVFACRVEPVDPGNSTGMGRAAVAAGATRLAVVGAQGGRTEAVTIATEAGIESRHFAIYELKAVPGVRQSAQNTPADATVLYMSPAAVRFCPPEYFERAAGFLAIGGTTADALRASVPEARGAQTPDLIGVLALLEGS